jgi:hypothetical protein
MVTLEETTAPESGDAMLTLGGVVSAPFETVTVTPAEVVRFPAASRATALSTWLPFDA